MEGDFDAVNDGTVVGASDGPSDGPLLGTVDGDEEGPADGNKGRACDGTSVGRFDAVIDGTALVAADGPSVGPLLGTVDGDDEGPSNGKKDDTCSGTLETVSDGTIVGVSDVHVGATVGAPVGPRNGSLTEGTAVGDVDEKIDFADESAPEGEFDMTDEGTMVRSGTVLGYLDGAVVGSGVVVSDGSIDRVNEGIPDP